eukprot:sb/3476956/
MGVPGEIDGFTISSYQSIPKSLTNTHSKNQLNKLVWMPGPMWSITEHNDTRNQYSKRQVSTICGLGEHSKIKKRPPPPPPLHFCILGPLWQISTLHPIVLKICMSLLLYEGP